MTVSDPDIGHATGLERENQRLTNLLEASRIATLSVDSEGRLRSFTPAERHPFGLRVADVGRSVDTITLRAGYPEVGKDVRDVAKLRTPIERKVIDQKSDRHFVVRIVPFWHGDRFDGIDLAVIELSAVEEAEQALEESEQRYRAFVTASSDAVYRMSPDWTEMRQLDGREFLPDISEPSEDWMDTYIDPSEQARVQSSINAAIESKSMFEIEHRVIRADGTPGWSHSRAVPILDRDGRIAEWIGTASDVTGVHEAEWNRRASDERLRSAIEVARVGTWDWDVPTGEITWSDEHYRMNGYEVGEVVPSYETWFVSIHPDDRAATEAALNRARETREEYVHEYRSQHADGSMHWFSARGRFLFDEAGEAIRMFGAMIEVTAAREQEMRQNVLVGELQHRTRNLMGVVRSIADKTMQRSPTMEEFQQSFGARLHALARVQGLLSRVDDHHRVTFDELIRAELAAHGVADEDCGRVILRGADGIPLRSSMVQMLALALHELATNAAKYGALKEPGGRLEISWRTLEVNDDPARLEIIWQEHGVVMPPDGTAEGRTGQGRELIERALPYQLDAETHYELGPDGIKCLLIIPISGALHD